MSELYLMKLILKSILVPTLMEKNGHVRVSDPVVKLLKKSPEFVKTQCHVSLVLRSSVTRELYNEKNRNHVMQHLIICVYVYVGISKAT